MVEILAFVAHGFVGEGQSDGSTNERLSREENGAENPLIWGYIILRSFELCSHTPSPVRRSFVRMRGTTATYADRWNSVWNSVYQKDLWRTFWWRVLYVSKGDGNFPRPPPVILGVNHNSRAFYLQKWEMSVWTKKKKQKQKRARNVSKAGVTAVK